MLTSQTVFHETLFALPTFLGISGDEIHVTLKPNPNQNESRIVGDVFFSGRSRLVT